MIVRRDGGARSGLELSRAFCHPWLVGLTFVAGEPPRPPVGRATRASGGALVAARTCVLVPRDALPPEQFRRLRVWLTTHAAGEAGRARDRPQG